LTKRRLVSIICPSSRQAGDITLSRSLITEGLLRLPDISLASRSSSPVQDIALSRRQHGFKSRTGRHSISVTYSHSINQRFLPGDATVTFFPPALAIRGRPIFDEAVNFRFSPPAMKSPAEMTRLFPFTAKLDAKCVAGRTLDKIANLPVM
jgi:hypothetical protein